MPEAFVLLEGHAVTPAISRRWGNSVTGGPQPPKKSPVSLGDGAVNGHVVVKYEPEPEPEAEAGDSQP